MSPCHHICILRCTKGIYIRWMSSRWIICRINQAISPFRLTPLEVAANHRHGKSVEMLLTKEEIRNIGWTGWRPNWGKTVKSQLPNRHPGSWSDTQRRGGDICLKVQRGTGKFGCWYSMWGSLFLSTFCRLSTIWPLFVHLLSPFCPTSVPVLFLTNLCSPNSYFCLPLVQFLSPLSPFWPLFAHTSDLNFRNNYWTKTGQMLDPIFFSFTAWSPCNWTKPG